MSSRRFFSKTDSTSLSFGVMSGFIDIPGNYESHDLLVLLKLHRYKIILQELAGAFDPIIFQVYDNHILTY